MKKEINEKTFELNITYEIIHKSRAFINDLRKEVEFIDPNLAYIFSKDNQQCIIFAEGLTQKEESDSLEGGYDVLIKAKSDGQEYRLMFLQFKAGIERRYSYVKGSQFHRSKNPKEPHISFRLNDAANSTQHSTLYNLAKNKNIQEKSVFYVFPRITKKDDFFEKIGNLATYSSFLPVVDIDKEAESKGIVIKDNDIHNFRTSYDGSKSEINLLLLLPPIEHNIYFELLSEIICVHIERFVKILKREDSKLLDPFLTILINKLGTKGYFKSYYHSISVDAIDKISAYVKEIKNKLDANQEIPPAMSEYTTKIPKDGLELHISKGDAYSSVMYQIF